MTAVLQAVTASGVRHELTGLPPDRFTAVRRATRAARLLGRIGDPRRWGGCRVNVVDAGTGSVVFAARIRCGR